jgi:hypothetical protein
MTTTGVRHVPKFAVAGAAITFDGFVGMTIPKKIRKHQNKVLARVAQMKLSNAQMSAWLPCVGRRP